MIVFVLAFLVQLPLALAPGYFSHDELQWAWRAGTLDFMPWWDDRTTFQFRPLTLNLWMVLSRALFETPWAFHSVLVAWGSANAVMLSVVGRRFGMARGVSAAGAIAFVLTPYAAYTHGWVATIADFLWMSCALVLAWCVLRFERRIAIAAIAFVIAMIGMLAKEAAAAIPILCAVAWAFDPVRRARWLAAMLGAGLAVVTFLAWRLPALLYAPRDGGTHYVPSVTNAPLRWLEYVVFMPMATGFEAHTVWQRPAIVFVCSASWLALVIALWMTQRRLAALSLLGGAAALAPVLVLGSSANHYAYGFAALTAMCVAAAWPLASKPARTAIAVFALLTTLHGVAVMITIHRVARIQSIFSPALAQAVAQHAGPQPLRLRAAPEAHAWVFERLTHQVPAYRGIPIGDRVRLVPAGEAADFEIAADGTLRQPPD